MKLAEMVESFLKNDNEAFEYIYLKCGDYCTKTLISKRNCTLEDAEDLFIDAVLIFRRKILNNEISYLINLKTYIYKICDNNFLAKLKKETTQKNKDLDVGKFLYQESVEQDPRLVNSARHAWDNLSEKCKDIIYLFYVEAINMEEKAKLLGLSNSDTAKSTKSRCYKRFVTLAKEHVNENKDELEQ